MRLYTRTGDDGTTGTVGGGRTAKDSVRMHAVGDVDEFNASLGLIGDTNLQPLQAMLFELGADLASPPETNETQRITQGDIDHVEKWIDDTDANNLPLKTFVLPGGSETASRLHYARTVCRRAERTVLTLQKDKGCSSEALVLLNRMSDLLFAMARLANTAEGVNDIPWHPRTKEE
jgi:cob(I)alamin adenosyltransferase